MRPKSTSVPFSKQGGWWQLGVLRIGNCMTQGHEVHVLASAVHSRTLMTKSFGVEAVMLCVQSSGAVGWEDTWSHLSAETMVRQPEEACLDAQQANSPLGYHVRQQLQFDERLFTSLQRKTM